MSSFRMHEIATIVVAMLLVARPSTALAQGAGATSSTGTSPAAPAVRWHDPAVATLMLVDNLGAPGARAVVIRRPGDMPNNIILVTRATTPADLADAVTALITSRRNRGDQVDREMRALIGAKPVGGRPPRTGAVKSRDSTSAGHSRATASPSLRLAASDLARLPAAPAFTIAGIGHGPALVVRMSKRAAPKAKSGS